MRLVTVRGSVEEGNTKFCSGEEWGEKGGRLSQLDENIFICYSKLQYEFFFLVVTVESVDGKCGLDLFLFLTRV